MLTIKIQCLQSSFDCKFKVIPTEVVADYASYECIDKLEFDLKKLQDIILCVNKDHTLIHDVKHEGIKFVEVA